jgi:hypothetical protein
MTPVAASAIAQQAFAELELRPLSSFGDDTPQATEAASALPRARAMVLGGYDWSFARALVNLPALTGSAMEALAADPRLPFAFALPAELEVLRGLHNTAQPLCTLAWRREGQTIRADAAAVSALITRRLEREDLFPATVQHAMALQMAMLMAPRYLTTRSKVADLGQRLAEAVSRARSDDAMSASHHRRDGLSPSIGDDWVARVTR